MTSAPLAYRGLKKGAFHIRTSKLVVPRHLKYFSKKDSKLGAVDYGIALGSFFF
jgi:hypothetical protein